MCLRFASEEAALTCVIAWLVLLGRTAGQGDVEHPAPGLHSHAQHGPMEEAQAR